MGEVSLWGQIVTPLFFIAVAYWAYTSEKEESQKNEERKKEEQALIDDTLHLTTTRNKFERHRNFILNRVAAYKLHSVIITDSKEVPQSVLLPYAQYKLYDRAELKERASHTKEEMRLTDAT